MSACVTGASHVAAGLPCQDYVGSLLLPSGTLLAAVADGAGSALHSALGAKTAVRNLLANAARQLRAGRTDLEELLLDSAAVARQAVLEKADEHRLDGRQLACTLLALVASPDGGAALQLGDGLIAVSEIDEEWCWVFWPQKGEYANTTYFLTDDQALSRVEVTRFANPLSGVALMSDGLESLALEYATRTAHNGFFNGLAHPLRSVVESGKDSPLSKRLAEFLSSDRVSSRADDDLSILIGVASLQLREN